MEASTKRAIGLKRSLARRIRVAKGVESKPRHPARTRSFSDGIFEQEKAKADALVHTSLAQHSDSSLDLFPGEERPISVVAAEKIRKLRVNLPRKRAKSEKVSANSEEPAILSPRKKMSLAEKFGRSMRSHPELRPGVFPERGDGM